MADEQSSSISAKQALEKQPPKTAAPDPPQDGTITPEYVPAEKALQKLDKPEVLSLAAFFSSKMTLGPDPETAKIMADTEQHHETCRLDGYKANLKNQDEDSKRRHEYRIKRLNHETLVTIGVLVGCLAGAGVGLYLTIKHEPVGSNILVASVGIIVYLITGKPIHRKDE